jgi:hypothetical protein
VSWCSVPGCANLALAGDLCPKHQLDQTVKRVHERKENGMKVKVTEGYQVKDKDGKLHTSGTIDMKDADARAALLNGWVTEAKAAPKAADKKTTAKKGKE